MKTKLPLSISSVEEAKKFLQELHINGESYHPEDSAFDIVFEGCTVSGEEANQLDNLMDQIYELENFDPCDYLCELAITHFEVVASKHTLDTLKDTSIAIVDRLVEMGVIKDCLDSDDEDEFEVQDEILDILCKKFNIENK